MIRSVLGAVALIVGLTTAADAATLRQTLRFDALDLRLSDDATPGSASGATTLTEAFAGFDPSLGTITGARLVIRENWRLITNLRGRNSAPTSHEGSASASANLRLGDGSVFQQTLSSVSSGTLACSTGPDTRRCRVRDRQRARDRMIFNFDAATAQALFADAGAFTVDWTALAASEAGDARTTTRARSGTPVRINLRLTYEPAPIAVPLPASGAALLLGLGGFAVARRNRRTS